MPDPADKPLDEFAPQEGELFDDYIARVQATLAGKHSKREYPQGRLSAEDEGAQSIVTLSFRDRVLVVFPGQCSWFTMPPDAARSLAQGLLDHADAADRKAEEMKG